MFVSLTVDSDVLDVLVVPLGHVAEVGEDDEPGEQTREGVNHRRYQTVPAISADFLEIFTRMRQEAFLWRDSQLLRINLRGLCANPLRRPALL